MELVERRRSENESKREKKKIDLLHAIPPFAFFSMLFDLFFFLSGTHMSLYSTFWFVSAPKQFILSRFQFPLS